MILLPLGYVFVVDDNDHYVIDDLDRFVIVGSTEPFDNSNIFVVDGAYGSDNVTRIFPTKRAILKTGSNVILLFASVMKFSADELLQLQFRKPDNSLAYLAAAVGRQDMVCSIGEVAGLTYASGGVRGAYIDQIGYWHVSLVGDNFATAEAAFQVVQ